MYACHGHRIPRVQIRIVRKKFKITNQTMSGIGKNQNGAQDGNKNKCVDLYGPIFQARDFVK